MNRLAITALGALAFAMAALSARAADATEALVERYARLPAIRDPQLSPDGTQIAFLGLIDGRYHVVIERFDPTFEHHGLSARGTLGFKWVHWANNERLLISAYASAQWSNVAFERSRLLSLDNKAGNLVSIVLPMPWSWRRPPRLQDNIVSWEPRDPGHILVSVNADKDGWYEIRRVDVETGAFEQELSNYRGPYYLVDDAGEPRYTWGSSTVTFLPRGDYVDAAGHWSDVSETGWFTAGYQPVEIRSDSDTGLAIGPDDSGRRVLRHIDFKTGKLLAVVVSDPAFDVSHAVRDEWSGTVVGAEIAGDRPRIEYIDAEFQSLQRRIDEALPGTRNRIVSTSADHHAIIVQAQGTAGADTYYLWNRDTQVLTRYADALPGLDPAELVTAKPVSYRARDGLRIPAYLSLPPGVAGKDLPAIILPNDAMHERADAGFDFLAQFLAHKGYAVLQVNYRGSSGYGKPFEDAGRNEWGAEVQEDIVYGAAWLSSQGIADPARICIVGRSFGGYSAALALAMFTGTYRCAASINGILDMAWYMRKQSALRNDEIGVSQFSAFGISPYHRADEFLAPLLIVHASFGAGVPLNQVEPTVKRLRKLDKTVEFVTLESGSQNLRTVESRKTVLRALDAFLTRYNPSGKDPDNTEEPE